MTSRALVIDGGMDAFTAIVNLPQAAFLVVSRIVDRTILVDIQPSVLPIMTLNLSCDHRRVDEHWLYSSV